MVKISRMNVPPFTLDRQYSEISSEIEEAVLRVLKGGQFIGGSEISKFESSFASLIGVDHVVGCNSGTDALVLALRALDIGYGDEVITASFSFFATAEAISIVGAKPVFVDIDPNTFLIDINQIENHINSCTKAIIPVHLFGNSLDMDSLLLIANKYNLRIIEDCAQATCTRWKDKRVGSVGDVGCFSFFPTKNLGAAGDGGAVTTSNNELAKKIRELAVHGSPKRYSHSRIGFNSRLDTIQAAVLNVKIKWIMHWVEKRQQVAKNYFKLIEKNNFLTLPKANTDFASHSWNQFVIKLKNNNFSIQDSSSNLFATDANIRKSPRNFLKNHLLKKGINSIIYYPIPIHAQIAYKFRTFNRKSLFHTEKVCTEVLSLPMFPEISYDEQLYVSETLNLILSNYQDELEISA